MLTIANGSEQIPLNFDDYYIQETYGGKDSMGFTLPLDHPDYQYLFEETSLTDTETGQRYLIKAIDEGQTTVNIKGELDLDELSREMLFNYTNGSDTVLGTISDIIPPGWTVQDHAYFNQRRTVELEAATPLDIIDACADTYSVVFQFNNAERIVHIYNPDSEEISGVFLTDELNLKSVNFKGKSSGFATRLYAKGKDNLTFSSINNGKDYVEDFSYSDKIVSVYWKDERYTIAENLLSDAKKRLKELAVPQQSYTCSVMDLARAKEQSEGKNDNIYAFLEFSMYQNVVLLDRRRKRRIIHKVAGIKRYPKYPEKNVITLSTVTPTIQNSVTSIQTQIEKPTSTFNQIRQAGLEEAGEIITGQLGGNYIVTMNPETQKPNGWAIMDTDDTETAVNVWRATLGGIGHSSNGFNGTPNIALTMDGKINASMILVGTLIANLIKAGVLSDKEGNFYLNMSTGELNMKNGTFSGILSTDQNVKVGQDIIMYPKDEDNTSRVINMKSFIIDAIEHSWNNKEGTFSIENADADNGNRTRIQIYHDSQHPDVSNINMSVESEAGDTALSIFGSYIVANGDFQTYGNLTVNGNFTASGTKSRIVDTSCGKRKLNAVESAGAWFQDYGESQTNEKGICKVEIDPVFLETVNTNFTYHCFLSSNSKARLYVSDKEKDYFIVSGEPNVRFDWFITAKQRGYETIRLEKAEI